MYIKPNFVTTNEQVLTAGEGAMHGDVIITPASLPATLSGELEPNDCLAYGEHTGHAHKLFADDGAPGAFELRTTDKPGERHLRVIRPTTLRHQEHTPIKLPPGDYVIGIQQEYDPFTKKIGQVRD